MIFVISALIFIIIMLATYIVGYMLKKNRISILSRLDNLIELVVSKEVTELDTPFKERIIIPFLKSINSKISKMTPKVMRSKMEQKLLMAGKPIDPNASKWLIAKVVLGVIVPMVLLLCSIVLFRDPFNLSNLIFFILLTIFLFYLPEIYLMQLANQRKKEIEKTLPDILDILTVSVEAGLSFDGAVNKLVDKTSGAIVDEFNRTFHEIRIGKNRKEAFMDMSKRCNVSDFSLFISSLIQADKLGIGISSVLRVQSAQMREKRKQRAQEKAMKAPVKILFPLIFFIFPCIFVVILGPAILKFVEVLGK